MVATTQLELSGKTLSTFNKFYDKEKFMAGQKGNKNRKYGRNRKWCEMYRLLGRRLSNKIKKLKRHIKRHPEDGCAVKTLRKLSS